MSVTGVGQGGLERWKGGEALGVGGKGVRGHIILDFGGQGAIEGVW